MNKNNFIEITILFLILLIFFLNINTQNIQYSFITKGIEFRNIDKNILRSTHYKMQKKLEKYNYVLFDNKINEISPFISYKMSNSFLQKYAPEYDTLRLNKRLELDPEIDLEKEIIYSMLLSTEALIYPTYEEFVSAVNIRLNIVKNSKNSFLKFDCNSIDRPIEYWIYNNEKGFILKEDKSLVKGLRESLIPSNNNKGYSFSCRRATEYIFLLSLVEELEKINKSLYNKIEDRCKNKAIKEDEFENIFLTVYASYEKPLPILYFIPGDRVYFKNPDYKTSNILGYEGSWMIYLGNNKFKNFWQKDNDFSFEDKIIEIYTYSLSSYEDENGELQINDPLTYVKLEEIKKNKNSYDNIVYKHIQNKDVLDFSRLILKYVHPNTSDIIINT